MNILDNIRTFLTPQGNPQSGSIGKSYFADNVRILFINGIGTDHTGCKKKCQSISKIFNNSRIDYEYLPLTLQSVLKQLVCKEQPNFPLAQKISSLLDELKPWTQDAGTNADKNYLIGGPRLLIIAHSGGGATLKTQIKSIPPKKRDLIEIVSLGSAHLFSQHEGWRKSHNFVARTDPIPFICSCLTQNFHSIIDRATHYIGQKDESMEQAHGLLNSTYQNALKTIATQYKQELISTH